MSSRKELVERYCEGFRRGDHPMVLDCLSDDVTWYLPGYTTLRGKVAFDGEIENPAFSGRPTLVVTRLVEESDTVVAVGEGAATRADGAPFRFAFCDVFAFAGDRIDRVESYVVPLPG
jgi:uncharacterized protein